MPTSIKGNGLEGYINRECVCPGQFLPLTSTEASTSTGSKSGEVNPEYDAWMKTDQQLFELAHVHDSTKFTLYYDPLCHG